MHHLLSTKRIKQSVLINDIDILYLFFLLIQTSLVLNKQHLRLGGFVFGQLMIQQTKWSLAENLMYFICRQ